jgi:hypothetical protein
MMRRRSSRASTFAWTLTLLLAACGDAPDGDVSGRRAPGDTVAGGAENRVVAPADTSAPPDFLPGSINAVAFEGSYACDPGFAPEVTFGVDGDTPVFRAYLDQQLLTSGTWSWDGTTLRIESSAGSFAFTDVAIDDGTLVLGTGTERWDCRYLPVELPRGADSAARAPVIHDLAP